MVFRGGIEDRGRSPHDGRGLRSVIGGRFTRRSFRRCRRKPCTRVGVFGSPGVSCWSPGARDAGVGIENATERNLRKWSRGCLGPSPSPSPKRCAAGTYFACDESARDVSRRRCGQGGSGSRPIPVHPCRYVEFAEGLCSSYSRILSLDSPRRPKSRSPEDSRMFSRSGGKHAKSVLVSYLCSSFWGRHWGSADAPRAHADSASVFRSKVLGLLTSCTSTLLPLLTEASRGVQSAGGIEVAMSKSNQRQILGLHVRLRTLRYSRQQADGLGGMQRGSAPKPVAYGP